MLSFTLPPHTYYASNLGEILFGHFVTTLNAAFERKLALADEGYESGSENFNTPTPLKVQESTMFPVMRTSPSDLLSHAPQLPASHITSLCITGYHAVALMTMKVPQFTAPCHLKTPWIFHSSHLPHPSLPYVMT